MAKSTLAFTEGMPEDEGIAPIESRLRHNIVKMPSEIARASGIVIFGRRIKSLVFTTDLALIKNCDADAVFAVYPFTPQQSISQAIIQASSIPVFCGVGGGVTRGARTVALARDAEAQGAMCIVLNAPITNANLRAVARVVDIPIVVTVANDKVDIGARVRNGAAIINVAGGYDTAELVASIRKRHPKVPIMATGGKTPESIRETIDAGANAITYTPPTAAELFRKIMEGHRAR